MKEYVTCKIEIQVLPEDLILTSGGDAGFAADDTYNDEWWK